MLILVLRRRLSIAVVAFAVSGGVFAAAASAAAPRRVPDNPLAAGSDACQQLVAQQTALGSRNFPDAEVEPYIAVDPTNPLHLITSVQQDRWNDGGANGLTNAVSFDGGATWNLATGQPAFTVCEGALQGSSGFFNRATDPWVSISADGKIGLLDQRLVQRERPGLRRGEFDHHQPLNRWRYQLAAAGDGAAGHFDHGPERQGIGDGGPGQG